MDFLARRRREMLEAMESCRPGSDDLSDPALAEVAAAMADDPELRVSFQRMQNADAAIKAVIAEVVLPAGLAGRISQRLIDAVPSLSVAPATTQESPAPLRQDHLPRPERVSRRRLLVGFAALTASAALLTAAWLHIHNQTPLTSGRVLDEAMDFFGQDNQPAGELVTLHAPPEEYPMSRDLRQSPLVRWRRVEKFLGGAAVAYELPAINGRATLFVLNRTVAGLPAFPPSMPTLSTGGMSAAAWQQGNLLYVLVVQGDAGTYSQYLDHSSGPLT